MSNFNENQQHWINAAAKAPKGMDIEQLVPGAIVAVSPNKITGATDHCRCLMEVVATSGPAIVLKRIYGPEGCEEKAVFLMQFHAREFYPAEHLLDAMKGAETPEDERNGG